MKFGWVLIPLQNIFKRILLLLVDYNEGREIRLSDS